MNRRRFVTTAGLSLASAPFLSTPSLAAVTGSSVLPATVLATVNASAIAAYDSAKAKTITVQHLSILSGNLSVVHGILADNGTIAAFQKRYDPATFEWTPALESSLVKLGQGLTQGFRQNDLAGVPNYLETYRPVLTKSADKLIYGAALGLSFATQTASLSLSSDLVPVAFPATPHLKRVVNAPCNWGVGAVAAGVVAGVAGVIPGGQGVAGFFALVAAVYAFLDYADVPCGTSPDWDYIVGVICNASVAC